MYFHVPVCADLKKDTDNEMCFYVPVCADLIRVLAHACAWKNITIAM